MIKNHFKTAWRAIRSNKTYTAISAGSLVLGITLFFFIVLWVKHERSYDRGFSDMNQLYRVETNLQMQDGTNRLFPGVGWPVGRYLASDYPGIEEVTYVRAWHPIINQQGTHLYEEALFADEHFLSVFSYGLAEGNPAVALKDPYSLVISQHMKEKYFPHEEQVLGKVLMLNDTIPYKVTGVLKELPSPSHLKFEMLGSLASVCAMEDSDCAEEYEKGWFDLNMYNYVKLRKGASGQAVGASVKNMVLEKGKTASAETGFRSTLQLRPVGEIYLYSKLPTANGPIGNITAVLLFLGIGFFVLLIACLNFINLSTAKSIDRAKEIGVKKVLGSNRGSLMMQFFAETALVCLIAFVLALGLMSLLYPLYNELVGQVFTRQALFSWDNMGIMLLIGLILVPLAGLYPALLLSSYKPIVVLKGKFAHSLSGTSLRRGLVVTQFVFSIAFIAGTLIVWKQMAYMEDQELGFDKNGVLVVDAGKVPWVLKQRNAAFFKEAMLSTPGISQVSASSAVPGRSGWDSQFAWAEGHQKNEQLVVEYIPVDPSFVKAFDLKMLAGRDFTVGNSVDSTESLIVNEAAIKLFGWKDPGEALGKQLSTSGKDGRIIGVLKDYHQHGLQQGINPIVLGMGAYTDVFAIRYAGISPRQLTKQVEYTWGRVFAGYPVSYRFMDEDFQQQYSKEEKFQQLFAIAAVLSILISCTGLFGLVSFTAKQRIKEIGIRKVLGASVFGIVGLLSRDFVKLVLIAMFIASPFVWWSMNQWLESFAYRIGIQWWMFAAAGLAAVAIALLTVGYQAIRAALADPVDSLRDE